MRVSFQGSDSSGVLAITMCGRGQLVTMMGEVKSPYVGHRFLEEPPCMTRVLPVRGVVGHYIDRCIKRDNTMNNK